MGTKGNIFVICHSRPPKLSYILIFTKSKLSWPPKNYEKVMNGSSYKCVLCTIEKSMPKQLKFFNLDLFAVQEKAVSNFHTNLNGAIKSPYIAAQTAPNFSHALRNKPSRE